MQILIKTDNQIKGSEDLLSRFREEIAENFHRFSDQITRFEVYFGDENSHKSGSNDKRCTMEARLAGLQPIAVTDQADSIDTALDGAIRKMKSTLDSTLGRLSNY